MSTLKFIAQKCYCISNMFKCITTGEKNEDTEFLYYMNEGVYGSFSHKLLGNIITTPLVHKVSKASTQESQHTDSRYGKIQKYVLSS